MPFSMIASHRELKPWQVLNTTDRNYKWPGDEWGDDSAVKKILETCLFNFITESPRHICELGAGAGRFTPHVIEYYREATVYSFDVSDVFTQQIRSRLSDESTQGRLQTFLLNRDPRFFLQQHQKYWTNETN